MSGKKSDDMRNQKEIKKPHIDIKNNVDQEPDKDPEKDLDQELARISDEYEAAYVPNIGALSQLLLLCKGGRTWQEYAGLCGVSPATFTRINKGMISKQVDRGLLLKIYKNQVTPDNPGLDELLKAGGWRKKRIPSEEGREINPGSEEENIRFDQTMLENENRLRKIGDIIRNELDIRGQMSVFYANDMRGRLEGRNPLMSNPKLRINGFGLRYYQLGYARGFTFQVQGMEAQYWVFFPLRITCFAQERDWAHAPEDRKEEWVRRILSVIMREGFSDIFLKDIWEPDALENVKTTIIFTNQDEFKRVGDVLINKAVKVNNWFSLLLVDVEQKKVVEERFLPRSDGKEKEVRSIFEIEPLSDSLFDEEFLWDDDGSDF